MTVPVHVASAIENRSIQFHQYHLEDMGSPGCSLLRWWDAQE
ncbi:non-homologous end joining protein Ku [Streptomyces canus]|uniref:Non-homologous end joining protein Ku n=1 Tax=Streptomyces canus TaxID=58343 RepID=A0AAW8FWW6_9ACTN|nr:non-homologous end joining protein Ku [Streptomyces canus]